MKTAHSPGERQTQTLVQLINGADTPVGFASRLWQKFGPVDILHRIDNIAEQFTGAGWKNLPQEVVDEILGYLNLAALKACSLTCKRLFGATRPLIHQRLVCWGSGPNLTKPKRSLFSRRKRDPGAFEELIDRDRLGILRYTRHLTLRPAAIKWPFYYLPNTTSPCYYPRDIQEYLRHLRSITKLQSLTLVKFHIITPAFNEYFGIFANTIRHLNVRYPGGGYLALLYIISQFPHLENLTIISPVDQLFPHTDDSIPMITQSPPLRGKLVLTMARSGSRELSGGLATFPGGLNFRSLELSLCEHSQTLLAACSHTATSISFLLQKGEDHSESSSFIRVDIASNHW